MALFQQQLQTEVISEQAVQEPSTIGAISTLAGAFLKAKPSASTKDQPNYEQSLIANFSTTIENLKQAKESGQISEVVFSRKAREARAAVGNLKNDKVPEFVRQEFENVTGISFEAMGRTSEQMEQDIILESDAAKALRPTVEADLIASGVVVTPESLNNALLNKVEKRSRDAAALEEQRTNLELGLPVEDTVISKNIQTDLQTLSSYLKNAVADGVVTRNEFLSAQLGVSNLMATKYGQFKTNPKISAVIEQMNGLIDDIGKRVGTGPMAAEIDKMTLALQSQDFTAGTIAVVRALYEGKDVTELKSLMSKGKGDKTVEAAMVYLMETNLTEDKIVEIFNTSTPPEVADVAGTNPSLLLIPSVQDNPDEYETVVDKFSESAKTPTSNNLLGNEKERNSFLTSLNVAGSAVASQSDEYILGEKLLSKFASNSIVKNLEAVYSVDPQNAAQTNDVLQAGLSSERVRQSLELNNRLDAGAGAGQLVMADAEGKLQLNNEMIEKNKDKLVGGAAGWAEMQGKINAAGGLEKFLQLPPIVNSAINTDASIMVSGTQYLLKDIFSIDFNKVLKLSNNLKLIDSKLVNLESLATKYQDDTDMLRGRSTNLTPSQNAEVMAAINEGSNLGLPLEDIDFDSNAPATPAEPAEEIVVTPIGGLNLDSSLDEILVSEGGFQNRPKDRGNYRPDGTLIGTNRGVTPNSLAEFKGVDPNTITEADIKAVTEDEARQIFKQLYFDKPKLNQLPVNLQEAVFDMQVNSGRNAVRILQKLAGMSKDKRDGYVGPETLKALQGVNITNEQYADARIEFYNNLVKSDPNQYGENLAGWIARANKYRN